MKNLIFIVVLMVMLCCCTSTRIVEVPVVHTEYLRHDSIVHDSIHQLDSVYVEKKGDTIYKEKTRYLYRFLNIYKVDTIQSVDTLTVVKEVEKKLTTRQHALMYLGKIFLIILFIVIIFWLSKR